MAFHPGTPDISRFPFALWRRIVAARLGGSGGGELAFYHAPAGLPALRRAIASHLALSRNVRCDPDQIVVTCGRNPPSISSAACFSIRGCGLDGGARLCRSPGALLAAGADLVPLPVSTAGWDLTVAARRPFRLAYLTPACQMRPV